RPSWMLETCSTTATSPSMLCTRWEALGFALSHGPPSWGMSMWGTGATGRPCSRGSIIRSDNPLGEFIERHSRLFVLTGAGCSTDSGIPDYRDENGDWRRARPVTFQAFVGDLQTRRRYWARSLVGWRRFGGARPNDAHRALARLEQQ